MQVKINNEVKECNATTIAALAVELGLPERGVAIAINSSIVPRTTWETAPISENDSITIIKAAFGG